MHVLQRRELGITRHSCHFRLLWSFDILPVFDTYGQQCLPSADAFQGEFTLEPVPFECRFNIRRPEITNVILEEASEADKQLTAWS